MGGGASADSAIRKWKDVAYSYWRAFGLKGYGKYTKSVRDKPRLKELGRFYRESTATDNDVLHTVSGKVDCEEKTEVSFSMTKFANVTTEEGFEKCFAEQTTHEFSKRMCVLVDDSPFEVHIDIPIYNLQQLGEVKAWLKAAAGPSYLPNLQAMSAGFTPDSDAHSIALPIG